MNKIYVILLTLVMALTGSTTVSAVTESELDRAINRTVTYLQRNVPNPTVTSVGGEWTVFALARSERNIPASYFARYFRNVENHVIERNGILDTRRITEHSRVILALTAAGYDPQNIAGYNLLLPLGDFEQTIWQGINGSIFALLALDSGNFDIPINRNATIQSTRELFVNEILYHQLQDGGWSLRGTVGDPDITAMALQALAKYRDNQYVKTAVEAGLNFLSNAQNSQGGFTSSISNSQPGVESSAQVLVALTELGIDINDPRFVKNGNSVLTNILSFQNRNGGFRQNLSNTDSNIMSTEMGLYALVAAQRAVEGRNTLYSMSDRVLR